MSARVPGAAMAREMAAQPEVVAALAARAGEVAAMLRRCRPEPLHGIVLLARGSSDHAAVYARYALELAAGCPVALGAPSLTTRYRAGTRLHGWLVIGVSQSGRTPEIVDALSRAGDNGARTLAVTNDGDSPLGEAADEVLALRAGVEQAVPATKTFTAQLTAFALLAQALGPVGWKPGAWDVVVTALRQVLEDPAPVRELAPLLARADRLVQVGRGYLYGVAMEAGLKVAETSGIPATGYSPADLRHGPIAAVRSGLALAFLAPGPVRDDVADVVALLAARGLHVVGIGEDRAMAPEAASWLTVPAGLPEGLAPIVHVVRGQQLALETALLRGVDPDTPAGLSKVTSTS